MTLRISPRRATAGDPRPCGGPCGEAGRRWSRTAPEQALGSHLLTCSRHVGAWCVHGAPPSDSGDGCATEPHEASASPKVRASITAGPRLRCRARVVLPTPRRTVPWSGRSSRSSRRCGRSFPSTGRPTDHRWCPGGRPCRGEPSTAIGGGGGPPRGAQSRRPAPQSPAHSARCPRRCEAAVDRDGLKGTVGVTGEAKGRAATNPSPRAASRASAA